jgi:hypothetical protein
MYKSLLMADFDIILTKLDVAFNPSIAIGEYSLLISMHADPL